MASIEEKADKINSILFIKHLRKPHLSDLNLIKQHLDKAVIVSHSSKLQLMIKKILISMTQAPINKSVSIVKASKEGSAAFVKEVENVKKCHDNHSFRLSYLERLLLEDQISLREFKKLRVILVKNQLNSLGELSKKRQSKKLNARNLQSLKNPTDNHINPYYNQY